MLSFQEKEIFILFILFVFAYVSGMNYLSSLVRQITVSKEKNNPNVSKFSP